jgi:putative membrane protein
MKTNTSKFFRPFTLGAMAALGVALAGANLARADDAIRIRGLFTDSDYDHVCDASRENGLQVMIGQIANHKADDPAVRELGRRIVQDDRKADADLVALMGTKGAALPDVDNAKDDKIVAELESLSGAEFEAAYVKQVIGDTKTAIKRCEKVAAKAQDEGLRNWANAMVSTLQGQLQRAENIPATLAAVTR